MADPRSPINFVVSGKNAPVAGKFTHLEFYVRLAPGIPLSLPPLNHFQLFNRFLGQVRLDLPLRVGFFGRGSEPLDSDLHPIVDAAYLPYMSYGGPIDDKAVLLSLDSLMLNN